MLNRKICYNPSQDRMLRGLHQQFVMEAPMLHRLEWAADAASCLRLSYPPDQMVVSPAALIQKPRPSWH